MSNTPIVVGFDVTARTVTLQFDEDIVPMGFIIGDKYDVGANSNISHELEVARLRETSRICERRLEVSRKERDEAEAEVARLLKLNTQIAEVSLRNAQERDDLAVRVSALRELVADLRDWAYALAGEWNWKRGTELADDSEMARLDADLERAKKEART